MASGCTLIGSLVIGPWSVSPIYMTPRARGGQAALFSLEMQVVDASVGIEVMVQTKNCRDTTWLDLSGFAAALTAVGVHTRDMSGFKEQYRLRVRFERGTASGDFARITNMIFAWRPC